MVIPAVRKKTSNEVVTFMSKKAPKSEESTSTKKQTKVS